jgi:hypothetical protein
MRKRTLLADLAIELGIDKWWLAAGRPQERIVTPEALGTSCCTGCCGSPSRASCPPTTARCPHG